MKATKKRKDLSAIEKFKIIQILEEKSKSRSQLALDYEISESTISKIWTKREDIKEDCKDHLNMSKKRFRESNYKEIEHCLYDWFCDKRKLSIPISGPMLCSKAADFATLLQINFNYDLDSILAIEDFLICERFNHVKQLTIHDYFKR